ncbi:MAG: restriction endonuclease subunit S [Nanoarchaeota archaeon]|nr:restriction endonuclease subunit S [Nanoarchaeota archaeon]
MEFDFFKLTRFFNVLRGNSEYTKEYGNKHKGEFPVYSASTNLPLTYIDHYDYDGEYLTWSTNGFGGFLKLLIGKFSINGDRGILIPKDKTIDIKYIQFVLQPILREVAKGRKGENNKNEFTKVSLTAIQEVEIPFPIKKDGTIDLEKQKEISEKYEKIEKIKIKLKEDYQKIEDIKIDINSKYETKPFALTEEKGIFEVEKGNPKYTKKYMHNHKGEFPVYSSQTSKLGEIGSIDTYDYEEECFTWTTDGTYVGTVFYKNGKFSITTHCGILRVKPEYKDKVDFEYLNFILNQTLPNYKLGESSNKRLGIERMKEIQIEIPIDENGELDLEKQIEIAEKHKKIEEIKAKLKDNYEKIINSKVQIIEVGE